MNRSRASRYHRALGPLLAAALVVVLSTPLAAFSAVSDDAGGFPWSLVARFVNFGLLVGILVYFLRKPVAGYLQGRSDTIRKDLVDAAAMRASAEAQLASVQSKLAALPAEIESLKRRGQEELAAERVRMKDATARARDQLVERTRREIAFELRQAKRQLVRHGADLAVTLARRRIESTITPEDHARLVERYLDEVRP
jgi:F-type H+-transporting ATPase subunit b